MNTGNIFKVILRQNYFPVWKGRKRGLEMKNIYLKGFSDGCIVYRKVELYLYIISVFQDLKKLKPAVLILFTTLV